MKKSLDREMLRKTVYKHLDQFSRCPYCNKHVRRDAQFCWSCGAFVGTDLE